MHKIKCVVSTACIMAMVATSYAQDAVSENQILLPEDLTLKKTDDVQLETHEIAGRLERVTVTRKGGFTEVYQNQRGDTLWFSDEAELGEVQNVRQWKIGSW